MKRFLYITLAILLISQSAPAQNLTAEQVLSNLLNTVKTSAIKTDFKLSISELKGQQPHVTSGTFTIKGSRFILEMNEMKVWFDGKTQWSYVAANNEVTITEPSEKELSESNPMAILSGYKNKCVIRFGKVKSEQNYVIEMVPKTQNQDISKVEVLINKVSQQLISVKTTNKKGGYTHLTLNNYLKGLNIPDNSFIFNPAKYKGVVENDLR